MSQGSLVKLPAPLTCWHESLQSARRDPITHLSLEGLFVMTDQPPKAGLPVFLELSLASTDNAAQAFIDGVVTSTAELDGQSGFGVHFVKVDDAVQVWLNHQVAALSESRLPPAPVTIDTPELDSIMVDSNLSPIAEQPPSVPNLAAPRLLDASVPFLDDEGAFITQPQSLETTPQKPEEDLIEINSLEGEAVDPFAVEDFGDAPLEPEETTQVLGSVLDKSLVPDDVKPDAAEVDSFEVRAEDVSFETLSASALEPEFDVVGDAEASPFETQSFAPIDSNDGRALDVSALEDVVVASSDRELDDAFEVNSENPFDEPSVAKPLSSGVLSGALSGEFDALNFEADGSDPFAFSETPSALPAEVAPVPEVSLDHAFEEASLDPLPIEANPFDASPPEAEALPLDAIEVLPLDGAPSEAEGAQPLPLDAIEVLAAPDPFALPREAPIEAPLEDAVPLLEGPKNLALANADDFDVPSDIFSDVSSPMFNRDSALADPAPRTPTPTFGSDISEEAPELFIGAAFGAKAAAPDIGSTNTYDDPVVIPPQPSLSVKSITEDTMQMPKPMAPLPGRTSTLEMPVPKVPLVVQAPKPTHDIGAPTETLQMLQINPAEIEAEIQRQKDEAAFSSAAQMLVDDGPKALHTPTQEMASLDSLQAAAPAQTQASKEQGALANASLNQSVEATQRYGTAPSGPPLSKVYEATPASPVVDLSEAFDNDNPFDIDEVSDPFAQMPGVDTSHDTAANPSPPPHHFDAPPANVQVLSAEALGLLGQPDDAVVLDLGQPMQADEGLDFDMGLAPDDTAFLSPDLPSAPQQNDAPLLELPLDALAPLTHNLGADEDAFSSDGFSANPGPSSTPSEEWSVVESAAPAPEPPPADGIDFDVDFDDDDDDLPVVMGSQSMLEGEAVDEEEWTVG